MEKEDKSLDQLVEAVLSSPKYAGISQDLVREVGRRELAKRRNLKESIKLTKSKLHQVAAVYVDPNPNYDAWLEELERSHRSGDPAAFRETCARIMAHHSSTRERLPILDRFYTTILAGLPGMAGGPRSVIDVACGLNPLAIPWMPLAEGAEYYAYDVYRDMVDFLNRFLAMNCVSKKLGIRGSAEARDVIHSPPSPRGAGQVDVALVLKALPCLEQVDKSAGLRLLDELNARHLVVSFPVHSLGGRSKGMPANYEAAFRNTIAARPWSLHRLEFPTELVFLVTK